MSYPGHSHSPSVPNLPASAMNPLEHQFASMSLGAGAGYSHVPHPGPQQGHRRRGSCKFFNSQKGFGFVNDDHAEELGGQEVFVHYTAISSKGGFRSLAEGEEVEYEIVQGPKGYQAANLTGPGGRNVIGDPKARLPKPHQFMSMSPMHPLMQAGLLSTLYNTGHDASFQQGGPYGQALNPYYMNGSVPNSMHGHSLSLSQMPYSTGSPASRNLMPYQGTPVTSGINGLPNALGQTPLNGYGSYPNPGGRSPYAAVPGQTNSFGGGIQGAGQPVFGQTSLPGSGSTNHLYNGVNRGAVGDGSPSRAGPARFVNRNATPPPAQGNSTTAGAGAPVPSGVAAAHARTESAGGSVERPASKNESAGGQASQVNGSGTPAPNGTPVQGTAGTPGGAYQGLY